MHIDMPTTADIARLASARDSLSVTIYLPTSPVPADSEHNLLRARELFETAKAQVRAKVDKRTAEKNEIQLEDLLEDTEFWFELGRSLAIYLTPTSAMENRLANGLEAHVSVGDRFSITPLWRVTAFPQSALVLALAQNCVRLVKVSAEGPAREIELPDAPRDAASAAGLRSIGGRAPFGRLQGDEGRNVRLTQYARAVDHALRPLLNGESLPLILAAAEPLLSIFRNNAGYAQITETQIRGNAEDLSDHELAESARGILDEMYAAEVKALQETFFERRASGRASIDLSDLARAAAFGNLTTVVVDLNAEVAGSVHDDGTLRLGTEHDALEEIARRALATGARVLALRSGDMPEQAQAAGILRFSV